MSLTSRSEMKPAAEPIALLSHRSWSANRGPGTAHPGLHRTRSPAHDRGQEAVPASSCFWLPNSTQLIVNCASSRAVSPRGYIIGRAPLARGNAVNAVNAVNASKVLARVAEIARVRRTRRLNVGECIPTRRGETMRVENADRASSDRRRRCSIPWVAERTTRLHTLPQQYSRDPPGSVWSLRTDSQLDDVAATC